MKIIQLLRKISPVLLIVLLIVPVLLAQTKRVRPITGHSVFSARLLIDPGTGKVIQDPIIEVRNGRIMRVGEKDSFIPAADAKIVDFGDRVIIPGLIDTHGHLFGGLTVRHKTCDMLAAFFLAAGVTTVRSPGSMEPEGDMGLQNRINSGRLLGPRYFNSGPYIEGDPVSVGWMHPVNTPEEVRLKIDQWIKLGASSVKIYAAMHGDLLRTAIAHGHAHGVKVIGHIGAVTYTEAISMGIDELFHGILAMPDIIPQDLSQSDYLKVYASLAKLDMNRDEFKQIIRLAAEYKTVLTPTAVVLEPIDPAKCRMAEQKPYFTPAAWEVVEKRLAKPIFANAAEIMRNCREFIQQAWRAGCILTTGTDQVGFTLLPGYSIWREMEIFSEAGMPPMEVLKAATWNGAYAIGRSDLLGSLEPGKLADFVVLTSDPLQDISRVREVHRVVKGGVTYDPAALLKPFIKKYHQP